MGILDDLAQGYDDPVTRGLLGAASGLAKYAAPSTTPASGAQALSAGMQGFMGGVGQVKKQQQGELAQALKMQEIAQKQAAEQDKVRQQMQKTLYTDIYKQAGGLQEAKTAYENLISSLGSASGVGDIASVIGFMKTLDPRSIVTDREADAVVASGGIFGQLAGEINKAAGSGFLSPALKAKIASISKQALGNRFRSGMEMIDPRLEQASRYGIAREDVAPTFALQDDPLANVPTYAAPVEPPKVTQPVSQKPASMSNAEWMELQALRKAKAEGKL